MQPIKKLVLIIVIIAGATLSLKVNAQQKTGWKEMDDFHVLSNQTLHAAIAGNFEPVKQKSEALLKAAQKWQQCTAPKGSDTPEYKADLDSLVDQCKQLNLAVKAGKPDEELRLLANKTHKTFHTLMAETVINH